MNKRYLNPNWYGSLEFLVEQFDETKKKELITILFEPYVGKKYLKFEIYDHQYLDSLWFIFGCFAKSELSKNKALVEKAACLSEKLKNLEFPDYDEDKWKYKRKRKELGMNLESLFKDIERELYKNNPTANETN